jgi:hypothetical protein
MKVFIRDETEHDVEYFLRRDVEDELDKLHEAIKEAWKIIDVLYMDALDHNGEAWPRAREWQEKWNAFSPCENLGGGKGKI